MTLSELKAKWQKEAVSYAKQEVGSGVQKFVKDLLKSEDLFNLSEGHISTKLQKRENEFTEESTTKAARKADILIYINSDIVIPIEVEKYKNITAGIEQLKQYQTDLEKKYGILTDGYTWQFYNNDLILQEFTFDEIFTKPDLFKDFWSEYIKPEFYYLSFFEEKGQQKMFAEDLSVGLKRQHFFKDITTLINSFKNKLDIEGYFKDLQQKEKGKKAVEITYAYIIQFILYKTLVDNEFDDFKKRYDEINESIYKCLKDKQYGKILGVINGISSDISKNIYRPFAKEQEFINNTVLELIRNPKNELHDVSPWLDIFIFIRKYGFANVKNEIFGYIYENYLKELYEETQKGQYFTDPAIVNFMLDQIGYNETGIKKLLPNKPDDDYISLIDPSCGSGTFLYSATDRLIQAVPDGSVATSDKIEELVNKNIFGLDIEEFPLYLAEMNIVMRMLPLIINEKYNNPIDKKIKVFLTKDSIAEFIDAGLQNTLNDNDVKFGQQPLFFKEKDLDYQSYVRDEGDLAEMKQSMRPPRRRFDFVIGNPPYVSYNVCSQQGVLIFELMKQGKVKLNDIYGMNLHSTPDNRKKYSPKPNLYVFFVALGLSLLKDNGKLCYIIPQTFLVNADFDVLRYHLAKFTTIEKIITFSGKMFVGRGLKQSKPIATSSLIFVVSRTKPKIAHQTEIIHYTDPNDDIEKCLENIANGKKIIKKRLLQNSLLQNIANWNFIKQDKKIIDFLDFYKKNTEDFVEYYNHVLAKQKFGSKFYFDGSTNIPKKEVSLSQIEDESYIIPELKSDGGYKARIGGYFPKNKKIKIAEGSQGLIISEPKYKILWKYINFDKFYYLAKENVLPIYQQYCITSENKNEILYLFSLLNSPIISLVLKTFQKVDNEDKLSFLLGLTPLKQFVRTPKIKSELMQIKNSIIKNTEMMLALEDTLLSDLVDFSNVGIQKLDEIKLDGNSLVLINDDKQIKCKIKDTELVKVVLKEELLNNKLLKNEKIGLSDLKNMSIIDFKKQAELKDYIDDLVFALYFNVPIDMDEVNKPEAVKNKCLKNQFYEVVNEVPKIVKPNKKAKVKV